jgi:hypothetical protein
VQTHNKGRNARNQTESEISVVTDFGSRAVCNQNYSRVVALPKQALSNCGKDVQHVNVQLVQAGTMRYLKLTPVVAEAE